MTNDSKRIENQGFIAVVCAILLVPGGCVSVVASLVGTGFALISPSMIIPCLIVSAIILLSFYRLFLCCLDIWNGCVRLEKTDYAASVVVIVVGTFAANAAIGSGLEFFFPDVVLLLSGMGLIVSAVAIPITILRA